MSPNENPSSTGSTRDFVTWAGFERRLAGLHKTRWAALTVWIILFSALVTAVLWGWRYEDNKRREDNIKQIKAIALADHLECIRSFSGLSTVLHLRFTEKVIKSSSNKEKIVIRKLFVAASPRKNCPPLALAKKEREILRQITTKEAG